MSIQKVIKITGVNLDVAIPKKDGSTYQGAVFSYFDNGKTWDIKTANAHLNYNAALKAHIEALEIGQEYVQTVEKNVGKDGVSRWNTISLVPFTGQELAPPTANKEKSTESGKSGYVDNSIGMQVGNALNVAGAMFAAGKVKNFEEAAKMVLSVGEELKVKLAAGDFTVIKKTKPKAAPVAAKPAVIVDEEVPWGD